MPPPLNDDMSSITNGLAFAREMLCAAAPEMGELLLSIARDTSLAHADPILAATAAFDRAHLRAPERLAALALLRCV